jgi:hypothetical protein
MELLNQLGDPERCNGVTNYWILKDESKGVTKISSKWRIKSKRRSSGWADGIRSTVRRLIVVTEPFTVFRMYCNIRYLSFKCFWKNSYWIRLRISYKIQLLMWQLSFPMTEKEAKKLSARSQSAKRRSNS